MSPSFGVSDVPEGIFVDAYFSHYHTTYPFLHEPTFRAQFNGTRPRPEGYSWFMLLNTVLALGAWCIGDDQFSMDDYFYQKLLRVSGEGSVFGTGNLALVQALLLLSNYTQKRNRPNTGWNYLGLAVRTAVSLGLHKEFSHWNITPLQREMRRRVWWGLFIFDSGAYANPIGFTIYVILSFWFLALSLLGDRSYYHIPELWTLPRLSISMKR